MNHDNKSSDEILNELFNSLNLPTSPISSKKEIKSDCNTESSDDNDTDASSCNNNSVKEIILLKGIEKSPFKQSKSKDKKRKKLKKDNKSKHKKKRKRTDDSDRKSTSHHNLPTTDLIEKSEKSLNVIADDALINCFNFKTSSKSQGHGKKQSQSRSRSRNREHHSKSKLCPSRSRSKSRTGSYSRSGKSLSNSHQYQNYSRSHSRSPSKNEKRKARYNRSSSHSHSPTQYNSNKLSTSRSRSPVKRETNDPLDIWRMAKLASLKNKPNLAGLPNLESSKLQQNTTFAKNLLLQNADMELPLETIPFPSSSSDIGLSSENFTEINNQKNCKTDCDNKDVDLTCIPFPRVEDCNSTNTSVIAVPIDKEKDSSKHTENICKGKEEGKSKIIVIKSLKDSLVFQQAEKAQIKKEKDGGEETELLTQTNTSDSNDENLILKKCLDDLNIEKIISGSLANIIANEAKVERDESEEKLISTSCEPIKELETESQIINIKKIESNESILDEEKNSKRSSRSSSRTRRKSRSKSKQSHSYLRKSNHSRKRKKSRSRSRNRSRSRSRSKKGSHKRSKRSRSQSRTHRKRRRSRSKSHSRDKTSYRRKSYSRENSYRKKSPDCVDSLRDKATRKRLLEVARRNAVYLMKNNCLPPSIEKESVKATGKSVEELTSFCKQLVAKEEFSDQELSDPSLSPDEDADGQHEKPFGASRHPFAIKDSKPILMNIRNAPMLPTKTNAERLADTSKLREQFPVSSGSQHRNKEGWVTVEKDEKVKEETVFPEVPKAEVDISSLVSTRLSAMRRLQDNPQDRDAINALNTAQKDMQDWALSKQAPGQFTGSTGVRILSQEELASGFQAWARKEQFKEATPVSSHFGMKMLQKMGWNPGEGLGKNKEGQLEPLLLDVKMDKKGLTAQQEIAPRRISLPLAKSLAGKHPVSALVEYCNKKKWKIPVFEVLFDGGPDHNKNFFMKVYVNGESYQSSIAAHTKKIAKANAAAAALQALGLVPRDPTPKPDATLNTTTQITATEKAVEPSLPPSTLQISDQLPAPVMLPNQPQNPALMQPPNPFPPPPNPSSQPKNQFLTGPQIPQTMQPVCYPHSVGYYGNAGASNQGMINMRMPNMPGHGRPRMHFMNNLFHR